MDVMFMDVMFMDEGHEASVGAGGPDGDSCTRLMVRSWILDQYEATGLSRRLTHLDLQHCSVRGGWPLDVFNYCA
ncbi:hypothetical protein V8C86DRAFT_3082662 [Haematococcus lacustris]